MKKFIALLLTVLLAVSLFGCNGKKSDLKNSAAQNSAVVTTTEFDTDYVKLRNGLKNTYTRLKTKDKFTVAYLGGSITAGAGAENPATDSWRPLVTAWLKESFADVEITEVNIGIGSTGSLLPSFYVDDYVIPKKPDLVFLEMAVNDYLDGSTEKETSIQYETIIRKLLTANPSCEIVSVYTINDVLSANEDYFLQAKAQNEVAAHYGIPSANVGRKLKKEKGLIKPKLNGEYTSKWRAYFGDSVHPTNAGHKEYANTVIYLLESAFKLAAESDLKTNNIKLPACKNEGLKLDTQFILASDLDLSGSKGWQIADSNSSSGLCISKNIYTETPENELVFTFKGENLYFYSSAIPFDESKTLYKVSIDGGEWKQVGPFGANPITVAENLQAGTHSVKFVAGGVGANAVSPNNSKYSLTAILVK